MGNMIRFLVILGTLVCIANSAPRSYRTLPSVSSDHYSEVLADGTYKYAYTGNHRYVTERRLADGTVEGETLYVRPDGIPIKVHYFADAKGYRPKTEVLYAEKVYERPASTRRVVLPVDVVATRAAAPAVVVGPPPAVAVPVPVPVPGPPHSDSAVTLRDGQSGNTVAIGSHGGDIAAASPSVTAIVGPGGHAEIRPEAVARTGNRHGLFRSAGGLGRGDVAVANPHTTAIVAPGASVVIAPSARASTDGDDDVRTVVSHVVPPPGPALVRAGPPPPAVVVPPGPQFTAVQSAGVVVVPPQPKYAYTYSYSAPDSRHPYRDNKAYVAVQVNQKKK